MKQVIIKKIDDEAFAVNQLIPSERELMEMFNVSRITVRKAVEELEQEGYLYKVQGKGTYVKGDQHSQDLFSITSCTQDVLQQGMTPSRKVLQCELVPADKTRQRRLQLMPEESVLCLSRVYYADSDSINLTTAYLPAKHFPGLENHDFSQESLYQVLEESYDVSITRAVRTVEAVIARDEVSDALDVAHGVPLLLFRCVTWGTLNRKGGKEVPIETFKCFYRSDRFKFYINQVSGKK